jgi:hypothetical protein
VLCLHGFPDPAWSFVPVLNRLAAGGYHAVAPFMRGYPPSGLGVAAYIAAALAPPFGGLYLKPPSSGGLCEGVMTIPSARPSRSSIIA